MRQILGIIAFAFAALLFFVESKSTTGFRVLVLLDEENDKNLYTQFFHSLEERDYKLTYNKLSNSVELFSYGERDFDHIIHFAPKSKDKKDTINPISLVNFVNEGGNILLAVSSELSENIRNFAREFDIEFDERDNYVIDHFNYDISDNGNHTLLISKNFVNNEAILGKEVIEGVPVLFRGIGHRVGTVSLLTKILWANDTAYSCDFELMEQEPLAIGNDVGLISAIQARNNARVTFVGSLEFFSDQYSKSGNKALVNDLTKWTFQEKGILRITSRFHHKEGEYEQLEMYRIKDNIIYNIEISEYVNDQWQAFNGEDVQLEIIMLDPHIRINLTALPVLEEHNARKYETLVQLPDVYGVFTFKVNYKRPGYTYIVDTSTVAIRPFKHNEYPRFISAAYPYYTGAASMGVGFLLFCFVWIFNKDNGKLASNKKKTN
ncbi:9358_t:CDS:2 [Funneliformis geosporum]|uniref:Dolichyl-diphosphooligosaccharide--protein glycosyltransferase subunit WBP1 n=1 Tax=Funneliformis geosporum TaxID=1117311 RepID=A0A9W4SG38_9GLOM|nr:9358_t:CDS:2 [Funneliformis geosporum]